MCRCELRDLDCTDAAEPMGYVVYDGGPHFGVNFNFPDLADAWLRKGSAVDGADSPLLPLMEAFTSAVTALYGLP
jgi:hypothetical protein